MGRSKKSKRNKQNRNKRRERIARQDGYVVPAGGRGMLSVTYPGGRKEKVPDDGRFFPTGTMISWDKLKPSGRYEMAWYVTGGGWPFDD